MKTMIQIPDCLGGGMIKTEAALWLLRDEDTRLPRWRHDQNLEEVTVEALELIPDCLGGGMIKTGNRRTHRVRMGYQIASVEA